MIELITKDKSMFSDIPYNQFFVWRGKLHQKHSDTCAIQLTGKTGKPMCAIAHLNPCTEIEIDRAILVEQIYY